MNVYIQLISAGTNTGPFNIYSDIDGFVTPFESNISKTKILQGFTSVLVPDDTSMIKIVSEGECTTDIYLSLIPLVTTTTTSSTTSTTTSTTSTTTTSTSSTTTTTTSSTTTTTTTTGLPVQTMLIARNINGFLFENAVDSCGELYNDAEIIDINSIKIVYFASNSTIPVISDKLYLDSGLTIPLVLLDNSWWSAITDWNIVSKNTYDYVVKIALDGSVITATPCSATTTTTTTTTTIYLPHIVCDDYDVEFTNNSPDLNTWTLSINLPTSAAVFTVFEIQWDATRNDVSETKTFTEYIPVNAGSSSGTEISSNGLYQVVGEDWTVTSKTILNVTPAGQYTIEACGTYGIHMCVNNTIYDFGNETAITYSLTPTTINTPTKAGYNYFFLSIPKNKDFTLTDTLGANLRSSMSVDTNSGNGGVDQRNGYQDNYIYKMDDVYATSFSMELILTII